MGRYFGRDLIVPRFLSMFAADLGKAVIRRDLEAARAAIAGLHILAPTTASRQLRLKVYIARVLMRAPAIARLVIAAWQCQGACAATELNAETVDPVGVICSCRLGRSGCDHPRWGFTECLRGNPWFA
ncbi:MAG TPA: hypothetical protein VFI48_03495 [Hyphomicrobiaceae bacterium]|nr:hypothetical protein [Hyphomicrobiaceae bacterium]